MKYAIIGSSKISTALVRAFTRKNIEVAIANSRGPETLGSFAVKLGPSVLPQCVAHASAAESNFLAVPFAAHKEVANVLKNWNGKIVVDVTNAFHVLPEELGITLSCEVVAQAFCGEQHPKGHEQVQLDFRSKKPAAKLVPLFGEEEASSD